MNNTIEISGKFIRFFDEKEYADIEVDEYDVLALLNDDVIADYACNNLELRHRDDFKSNLEDFSTCQIVEHLENQSFNFAGEAHEDDMLEYLESAGYVIDKEDGSLNNLDYIDTNRLEEITAKFLNGSWAEKELIYKLICLK